MLRFTRRRARPSAAPARFAIAAVLAAASAAAAACSGSTSTEGVAPTTGIVVRAETITGGRGCGRSATEVFKYVVVVLGQGTRQVAGGNVYDCFTDGTFVELDPVQGSYAYELEVFAYNAAAFTAASTVPSNVQNPDGLRTTNPTWTTRCHATQLQDVQALALCAPLTTGLGGLGGTDPAPAAAVVLATTSFVASTGGDTRCDAVTPVVDAGATDSGDAGNAGDAAVGDGGTVSPTFRTVRYRTSLAPTPIDVPCELGPIRIDPAVAPADYRLEVALLDPLGRPVGTTACTATTSPGLTSSAACAAVQPSR